MKEREHWGDYMSAYEKALQETSKSWAPWYAIPADNKPYMRYAVAKIIVETLESLNMDYPKLDERIKKNLKNIKENLVNEKD